MLSVLVVVASLRAAPAGADNLCSVLEAVRKDAPKHFESIVDKSKADGEHRYASKQKPSDAASASVTFSSGAIEGATWEAKWASKGSNVERLNALAKRVMACSFGKGLVGRRQAARDREGIAAERDRLEGSEGGRQRRVRDPRRRAGRLFDRYHRHEVDGTTRVQATPHSAQREIPTNSRSCSDHAELR